ncbi:hypothetical protein [Arthrobacter sp. ISL-28]|uniref:hypothetical protein n=1 Tax=Arthrobacter sp. ISL-28 TaxID=2819108 RepID=UPI001BEC4966|nr:hypothetical protein [Arthrobacter sp. ISL-28]MBT2521144.1 hypothetical protein [Arthrobacter sp. ISL-28]
MSEKKAKGPPASADRPAQHGQDQESYSGSPSTQQMRTVGRRRRDAEEKLEHHLDEARHKNDPHPDHH